MKRERHPTNPQMGMARAYGNLKLAQEASSIEGVFLEDLCYNAQQTAEKALKAVCIHFQLDFPRIHSLVSLIDILEAGGIFIPPEVKAADILTQYAVSPRYPGVTEPITKDEYREAIQLAENVIHWADATIRPK